MTSVASGIFSTSSPETSCPERVVVHHQQVDLDVARILLRLQRADDIGGLDVDHINVATGSLLEAGDHDIAEDLRLLLRHRDGGLERLTLVVAEGDRLIGGRRRCRRCGGGCVRRGVLSGDAMGSKSGTEDGNGDAGGPGELQERTAVDAPLEMIGDERTSGVALTSEFCLEHGSVTSWS
ncbi:MAG: hypothetical protein QM753_15545 [Thermomicrobiales bacterium]